MQLVMRPAQQKVFEEKKLRDFAVEVAAALTPVVANRQTASGGTVTREFAFEQLKRAETRGLKRRDEMMAWTLCALVHGPGFDEKMPRVRQILADRNYDRSVLFTQLAIDGLEKGEAAP